MSGGKINDPSSGKYFSLPFLPATPSSPSRALLPEHRRYKDTHCKVGRAKARRTPSRTADANLDCEFVENAHFLHRSLIVKSQQNRMELVTRPGWAVLVLSGRHPLQLYDGCQRLAQLEVRGTLLLARVTSRRFDGRRRHWRSLHCVSLFSFWFLQNLKTIKVFM